MRTVRDKDPGDEALIAQIREALMQHEEPYSEGAWEKFNTLDTARKRRPVLFWIGPLSGVAALLLITAGLYLYSGNRPKPVFSKDNIHAAGTRSATGLPPAVAPLQSERQGRISPGTTVEPREIQVSGTKPSGIPETHAKIKVSQIAPDFARPDQTSENDQQAADLAAVTKSSPAGAVAGTPKSSTGQPAPVKAEERKPGIEEFLQRESLAAVDRSVKDHKANRPKTDDKWDVGVMVAPSISNNNKLNMGYGVNMDYALSGKISLSSGISYNQLAASGVASSGTEGANYPASAGFARESRTLESVETKVAGIDIPLELKYRFSKNFYANVGVSAFAVISQNQKNSYVEEKLVQSGESLHGDNKDGFNTIVTTLRTTESAPQSELSNDKYIGFYNFSVGYRQKIAGSRAISVEPFMKVPMKEVTRENLKLIGTGLRLKFDF
ncbi:outer membrane beta-barrel protein [Pedobacter sp. JY14-1]|uniref:outer membrane beta-barrel protein n=1 Tax=Pedobacter sp. JY14-1 TaxID=3034151 RepID=UPI0023E2A5AE|nr:outer membrane beta-barrel protein [Pedobacter sp. JY14-1]